MALWMVRSGKHGEREQLALSQNLAIIGWENLPDLSQVQSRQELEGLLRDHGAPHSPNRLRNWVGQIWRFIGEMAPGDLVAMPLKHRSALALGWVRGAYAHRKDLDPEVSGLHTRPVEWVKEVPRSAIDQDLLYSLGAFMTVCKIQRNQAEKRIQAFLESKNEALEKSTLSTIQAEIEDGDEEASILEGNLEGVAQDQIRTHIGRHFKGHQLTYLVDGVLRAYGYQTHVSPQGPDHGVDIVAGSGELGFGRPRLVVQVKSSEAPIGQSVVRELQGAMSNFNAEHGLVVAWGGFKSTVDRERSRLFFQIQLWDADDLIDAVKRAYDSFPEALQADIPLKRVWMLVPSTENEA